MPDQVQPAPGQTVDIQRPRQDCFDIEPGAAVFDTQAQATTRLGWNHVHMHTHVAAVQLVEPLIALAIIAGKALHIAFESGVQAQHAMLQGIGVQLGHDTVQRSALAAQAMYFQE